jgi:hypothetical protein
MFGKCCAQATIVAAEQPFLGKQKAGRTTTGPRLAAATEVSGRQAPNIHRCSGTPPTALHHKRAPHRRCCRGRRHGDGPCPDEARRRWRTAPRTRQSEQNPRSSESTSSFFFSLEQPQCEARRLTFRAVFKRHMDGWRPLLLGWESRSSEQILCSKNSSARSSSLPLPVFSGAENTRLRSSKYSAPDHRRPAPLPSSSPTASDAGRRCASVLLPWSPDSSRPHSPESVR